MPAVKLAMINGDGHFAHRLNPKHSGTSLTAFVTRRSPTEKGRQGAFDGVGSTTPATKQPRLSGVRVFKNCCGGGLQ